MSVRKRSSVAGVIVLFAIGCARSLPITTGALDLRPDEFAPACRFAYTIEDLGPSSGRPRAGEPASDPTLCFSIDSGGG